MTSSRRVILSGLPCAAALFMGLAKGANATDNNDLQELIEKAIQADGSLELPKGDFIASGIPINRGLTITGLGDQTRLISPDGQPIFTITTTESVTLRGLSFSGPALAQGEALVTAARSPGLLIDMCRFSDSPAGGLHLEGCGGAVTGCHFSRIATTALFARDSTGLDISGNRLEDIGNNGIQVWTSEPAEDGTRVTNNHIVRVAAKAGGTGQNGNGINVYRAGNVIVAGNRISDCAFSAIRNNSGSACLIANNAISRIAEVAIYCEFGFEGAVVSGNMLDDVALGISITNFNEGGRLAAVTGNVIRKVTGGGSLDYTRGVGIAAEADTAITGNVIDGAVDTGISLGWGGYSRNLSATGNVLRDCGIGIGFSVSGGAGPVLVANNRISGSRIGSIMGTDHGKPATQDLARGGAEVTQGIISGNLSD
ncbi:MAG: TIGR03808 family TAT-translocated repetitive protein [Aestuariivirga sp.]